MPFQKARMTARERHFEERRRMLQSKFGPLKADVRIGAIALKSILTFESLSEITEAALYRIDGVGRKTVREIRMVLRDEGIELPRGESPPLERRPPRRIGVFLKPEHFQAVHSLLPMEHCWYLIRESFDQAARRLEARKVKKATGIRS